jgi:hypothetical protein
MSYKFNPLTGSLDYYEASTAISNINIILLALSIYGFNGGLISDSTFGFDPIDLGGI